MQKYPWCKADPFLYDLWTELLNPYEMSGKRRNAFYFSDPVPGTGYRTDPVLKALLPDPASLGPRTVGKTNIGCIFTGVKDGKEKTIYIYNVCDHQECYKEVGSQAISYTTGVPAMIGVMMVVTGAWKKDGVFNVEEFDPDPFMDALNKWGLPWQVCEDPQIVE